MHPEMRYKLCKFYENRACKGYAPAGRLYSTFWKNLSKIFSFWGPTPLSLHRWGWNLAWRRGSSVHSSVPNVTTIGATCRPCGAKNLKIGLWVNIYRRLALRAMLPLKKLNVFGHPGGGWNPSPTKLGMVIEDLEHVLASEKLLGSDA